MKQFRSTRLATFKKSGKRRFSLPSSQEAPVTKNSQDGPCLGLLDELRQPSAADAWERFVRQYAPLLSYWARRCGLQDQDAADLVQDVLIVLLRKLPNFQYQPGRSFRGWLRTVLLNKWRDRRRVQAASSLDNGDHPEAPADAEAREQREHGLYVLGRALRLMAADFEQATWQACWETVVCGRPAEGVAAELGITVNAVYLAKGRVLSRLRDDLKELI